MSTSLKPGEVKPSRSLRWQLTILSLGLLLPTLVFVGLLLWQFSASERNRAEEEARGLSHGLSVALDREIVGVLTTLQALATSPSLENGDFAAFYRQIGEVRRLQGIHISLRHVEGRTILTTRAPLGAAVPVPAGLAEADREVIRSGKAKVTDVFTSTTAGRPVFQVIAAPVPVNGAITYLLGASLEPDYLVDVFRRENLPRDWIGSLIDGKGIFVARTEGQESFSGKPASSDYRKNATGSNASYYGRNSLGVESLVGFARSELTGWTATVNIPADVVAAPLRRALMILLGVGSGLVVIACWIAVRAARRIDGAILRLRDVAQALGHGSTVEEDVATPVHEVNQVGAALREAARQLQDRERARDEAEAALREQEARLRFVVEGARDHAILTTAPDGIVTSWSAGAAAIFGWTVEEMVGRDAAILFTPEDRAAGVDETERLSAARYGIAVDERWHVRRDGSRVFMNGSVHPLPPDPDGHDQGFIKVARDETERRRTDLALKDLTDTLEHQVAERTAALDGANRRLRTQIEERAKAEDALRQSQKMDAVGQLTGGIAHDFNNLLTGIIGSLELMLTRMRQGRTDALERYAGAAMSSATRAGALTHRLLAFARRQPLDPRPVDANGLVRGMEDLLRRTLGEAVALEVVAAGGLWLTLCDPHQLENTVLNLVINARDAMPGGGRLTIETANAHLDHTYARQHADVAAGQYVCVGVSDTGVGMPPDIVARAFEPFFTTKPMGQGTGLGLSMIYGFAKQSAGHVQIYSEVGRGTTVKLYLPRHHGAPLPEQQPRATAAHRARAGETVLVVEDEPVVRDLIVEVLGNMGYETMEAIDGPSGLAILHSDRRIDLVVTDVGLPRLDGRSMMEQAGRPGIKVLFVTGYAENATFGNGHLDSGAEMITKPFSIETLTERVHHILGEQPRP